MAFIARYGDTPGPPPRSQPKSLAAAPSILKTRPMSAGIKPEHLSMVYGQIFWVILRPVQEILQPIGAKLALSARFHLRLDWAGGLLAFSKSTRD